MKFAPNPAAHDRESNSQAVY